MEGQKEWKAAALPVSVPPGFLSDSVYRAPEGLDGLNHTSKRLHPEDSEHGAA